MAGSRESGDGDPELDVAVESFLRRVFFSCLLPSEVIAKLNITYGHRATRWLDAAGPSMDAAVCNVEVTLLVGQPLIGVSSQPQFGREL
jgi:hypothetical protein